MRKSNSKNSRCNWWLAKSYDGRIMKVSKSPQENNPEIVTNEHDKETAKEKYISPEKRQEIIDEWRLK